MEKIIESIPNISEGRNDEIVKIIADQVKNTPGCIFMDCTSDVNHNRSVITYMGSPAAVEEASVKIAIKAAELIDLRKHKGEHPRMGAVDVMPFVPLKNATMEDCIKLSEKVGKRIYEEAGIPVYLYEKSAKKENRKNLADIRRGGFEKFNEKICINEWKPDFGERKIHPSAGVVAVGARKPLIAFNIQLNTSSVEIAKKISKTIRESSGGLKCVKAIGVMLESRNTAQVSMNLTDYEITPPHIVVEAVRKEAKKYDVEIVSTELIGLMPMKALTEAAGYYMKIENFNSEKDIIEEYL